MTAEWLLAIATSVQALAVVVGGVWALNEIRRYRQDKVIMQLDLDTHLYRLASPVSAKAMTWKKGEEDPTEIEERTHPYALEVLLYFKNLGRTRFRLYNAMIGVNTMRPRGEVLFNEADGHLHLTRVVTSGNIVSKFDRKGRSVEETSFFYIEPGVEQTISYVTLLPELNELIQIEGSFSLEKRRIFPKDLVGKSGLYPHNVVRTYQIVDGQLVGRDSSNPRVEPVGRNVTSLRIRENAWKP